MSQKSKSLYSGKNTSDQSINGNFDNMKLIETTYKWRVFYLCIQTTDIMHTHLLFKLINIFTLFTS